MNAAAVRYLIGSMIALVGAAMAAPLVFALVTGEGAGAGTAAGPAAGLVPAGMAWGTPAAFAVPMVVALVLGLLLRRGAREHHADEIGIHEVVIVVVGAWCAAALIGAAPLWLSGALPDPVDAWFEAVSGFTTTSATAFFDVERQPRSILLWRSLLNWLGGLGIVVLFVSVFPRLGVGGNQLFRTEMSNVAAEKLRPRIREAAKALWGLYTGLTAAAALLLWAAGLPLFDAALHALSTVSTGGFSTRNAGIGAFANPLAESVTAVFMFLGATNFSLLYRAVRRGEVGALLQSREFRAYVGVTLGAALLAAANLWGTGLLPTGEALRVALFQVVSVISTAGISVADPEAWPAGAAAVVFALMFVSGMSGSTAGGPKMIRILIAAKHGFYGLLKLLHPRSVTQMRLGELKVPDSLVMAVGSFLFLYLLVFLISFVVLSFAGMDMVTAASTAIASLGNTGAPLGQLGPYGSYAALPAWLKLYLSAVMLVGRLEIYGVLLLFLPSFWSRK